MKKLWLRVREATVRRMLDSGSFTPDQVLVASTSLLVGKGTVIESDVYYDAVRWAVTRKFSGMSDKDLWLLVEKTGVNPEGPLAYAELARRAEG